MRLVLASASARRHQILASAGVSFETMAADLDEEGMLLGIPGSTKTETAILLPPSHQTDAALLLAREKASAIIKTLTGDVHVLAADTIVVQSDTVYGKPENAAMAAAMLRELSGRSHTVITAHVMMRREGDTLITLEKAVSTVVRFRDLSDDEIRSYVATGEPLDKAGAYAIQGIGATLISSIQGDYLNVIGLSLNAVLDWIRPTKLFAYGTLMRKMSAHALIAGLVRFIDTGTITGLLYDLGEYPAAVEGQGIIHGELYEVIDPRLWDELDRYEGCNSDEPEETLYRRKTVSVKTTADESVEAMTYMMDDTPETGALIESGHYRREDERALRDV